MNHGSLFSGIGGFDLAAEWMGWNNVFHCEWEEFPRQVLKHHFPDSISYGDIKETDFTIHRGQIDILTGGFPCQPYSQAGKRKGKEDERHLWPEMLRAIREIQPRWIVGENVYGLVNWSGGLVFEEVCADLENEGYEVQPVILPACAKNAPHRRDRVWFIAYTSNNGLNDKPSERDKERTNNKQSRTQWECATKGLSDERTTTNTGNKRLERSEEQRGFKSSRKKRNQQSARQILTTWNNFPTQSPVCGGDDGIPERLDNITFPKWRNESIKAYGNAIVPQVAYEIFKTLVLSDSKPFLMVDTKNKRKSLRTSKNMLK